MVSKMIEKKDEVGNREAGGKDKVQIKFQ